MEKILELKNISLTYQGTQDEIEAVKNLSFYCPKGKFISIIGPSGCGKTTILSIIAGLIKPTNGEIKYNTQILSKNNFGYMLQKDNLLPWRNVEKNIYLPLEVKKIDSKENKEYAMSLLKKYGIYDFRKKYPNELSGGMRQRVALIRTLVFKPDILLLDEPFSALDCQTRLSVSDDVYNIIKAEQKTSILVTHDIGEAISMSDIIITLTNRPSQVKSIFELNLKGDSPLAKREDIAFSNWFEKLRKELNL